MERNVKHLLLRKTDVLKTAIFSEEQKSKKVQGLALSSSAAFRLKNSVSDFF